MYLSSDAPRLNALVSGLGRFLAQYLSMKFPVAATHPFDSDVERQRALKVGRPFHELIEEDSDVASNALIRTATLQQRKVYDAQRRTLEAFYEEAKAFCRTYNIVLARLDQLCKERSGRNDCIRLKEIAAPGDEGPCREQVRCFFLALQLEENVSTGYFSRELALLIVPMVESWIDACEAEIKRRFDLCDGGCEELLMDRQLATATKKELTALIIKQVSMMETFDPDLEVRQPPPLQAEQLEQVCKLPFNAATLARCEQIRSDTMRVMKTMKPLCAREFTRADVVERHCVQHANDILTFLKRTPRVLRDRPGYSSLNLNFEFLEAIVKKAASSGNLVFELLEEWRQSVGQGALTQLSRWIDASCLIMEKQEIPESGFLPTLCCVRPPTPPWRSSDRNWHKGNSALALIASCMKRTTGVHQQYLPIPNAVHAVVRLVSMVWELVGHHDSYEAFFAPGEVLCSIVKNTVAAERVTLQSTFITLNNTMQNMAPGASYRRAVLELINFRRDPKREIQLRTAMQCLSKFPLHEIVTAAYENSRIFHAIQINLLNCASGLVDGGRNWDSTWVVRRALQTALPIICQLGREARISPFVAASPLGEALLSIPAIREWNASSPQLIVTLEEAKRGVNGIVEAMKHLSEKRRIVRYGRLPPSQRGEFGSKAVFVVNAYDLVNLLSQSEV